MTNTQREFLNKLADLCDEYKAEFLHSYDGEIAIHLDSELIFRGPLHDQLTCPEILREAAKKE